LRTEHAAYNRRQFIPRGENPLYTGDPDYVCTPQQLDAALRHLDSDVIAIDTEFLRESTYYPKFCLLQMATDSYCALVDVLALPNLQPLLEFLNAPRLKVLHAAHQDLEVLALARGALLAAPVAPVAGPFFDTQVAAAFVGLPGNIGYADLVQRRLDRTLDKGQSRTDWSRRPLSAAQLRYAAADVTYLMDLYHNLKAALAPRWEWVQEEARSLSDPTLYSVAPVEAWRRLRGLEQLPPHERAAAKALAAWREQRAMDKDLPRAWILSDDALRAIAHRLPSSVEQLAGIGDLPRNIVEKRAAEILQLVVDAKIAAIHEPPARDFRPSSSQQRQVTKLMNYVRQQSVALQISPERLATRRDIEALVYGGRIGAFGGGWRKAVFGDRLVELAALDKET
jgi:ribonuclease D